MTSALWARAKLLYFEASDSCLGAQAFLSNLGPSDAEAVSLVRELLEQTETYGPKIDRPCWTREGSEQPRHTLELGQTLHNRFEIVGFLGSGGVGEVYRAFDLQQSVFVALKTLLPAFASDPAALANLRHELNTARLVTSPYVCRLHDFHWTRDSGTPPFFTMELVEGETLAHYLSRQGPFTYDKALPLAEQMIVALESAHGQRIVHRDFKSGNVMLTQNATRAVVMDFGLAHEIASGVDLKTTLADPTFAGTPAYMAPEQLRGQRATFASDVYSLGVVLFEMVTGRRPFEGDGPMEIALRRLNEAAPSPRKFIPGIDRRWEHAVIRCLEADKMRRPASASAVRQLLIQPAPLLWQRRRVLVTSAAALAITIGAGGWWTASQQQEVVGLNVFDIENQSGDSSFDFLCRGTTSELIRRFASSERFAALPMRAALRDAGGRARGRFSLSGFLSKDPRMFVQLSDSAGHKLVWSKSYGSERFGDLVRLQQEIANETSSQLIRYSAAQPVNLLAEWFPVNMRLAKSSPTESPAAFDLYMRGHSLLQEGSENSLRAAASLFEQAIAEDGHFALAMASLAECHLSLLNFGSDFDSSRASAARRLAAMAAREDPSLAEAHAVLGAIHQVDWDWAAAEANYDKALKLKPRFARALRWRAGLIVQFARFSEAITGLEEALRIDPYDRATVSTYGLALISAGRSSDAVKILEREIGNRDMVAARFNLALAHARLAKTSGGGKAANHYAKAIEQARRIASIERQVPDDSTELSDRLFALVHSMRGALEQAAPYLARLERAVASRISSPGANSIVYVAQHRFDVALTALERATMLRDRFVLYLRINLFLEELRGTPRFEALLHKLGLV